MKRAIRVHRADFAAIVVLVVAAIAVTAYILEHQPSFVFGQTYYSVKAPFSTAAAVTAGQGQAVTIAGVQVGQVGAVSLQDGQAVVTIQNAQTKFYVVDDQAQPPSGQANEQEVLGAHTRPSSAASGAASGSASGAASGEMYGSRG